MYCISNIFWYTSRTIGRDAQTDIFHLLTQSEQAAHRKYEDIMLEFMKRPAHRAARIDISKLTSIHCKYSHMTLLISAR